MTERGVNEIVERLAAGDVRALARAISLVEDGGGAELVAACRASGKRARRIGVTGPAGAGKSTLVDQMVRWLRGKGERVGVVAIDPSSPYTGGALLGDRIRMQGFDGDEGVYIRSMASRGAMGGLTAAAEGVCCVMEAAGRGTVIVETVGVGQDEVDVAGLVDCTVVVAIPGAGDDVQSLKAGLMEAADVIVVNKSDLAGADRVEGDIRQVQGLAVGEAERVPAIVRAVATTGVGVEELMAEVERFCASGAGRRVRVGLAGMKIDHLGVAVRSIAAARGFYELLGLAVGQEEAVEHEQVKTLMLQVGESRIELLEATAEDSTIGRFVAKRGEGMHHVALGVTGIEARFEAMRAAGIRLASDQVRIGAGGHKYFFVHPGSTGGVLVELVEAGDRAQGLGPRD